VLQAMCELVLRVDASYDDVLQYVAVMYCSMLQ